MPRYTKRITFYEVRDFMLEAKLISELRDVGTDHHGTVVWGSHIIGFRDADGLYDRREVIRGIYMARTECD